MTSSITTLSRSSDAGDRPSQPLIHPLSALLLIIIDNLWTIADWAALMWIITIPLSFFAVLVPAFLVQKYLKGDRTGRSFAVSTFLAVLAAVPTPVTGTVAGTIALGFAGFRALRSRK